MKQAEATKAFLEGRRVLIVEFRARTLKHYPAAEGKPAQTAETVKILMGDDSADVTTYHQGTLDEKAFPALERGKRLLVEFESLEKTKFGTRLRGKYTELTT
jgi:leucyl aminopeptidase